MSKFHNDWIKIQGEIASYKNEPKFRCKINIFGLYGDNWILIYFLNLVPNASNQDSLVQCWLNIKRSHEVGVILF